MDDLARLAAIADIMALKARYFRCLDTKDWDGLAAVFAPDAEFDLREVGSLLHPISGEWSPPYAGDEAIYVGRPAVLAMIRASVGRVMTAHHGHMPEIDVTGETTARGIWAMEDLIRNAPGEPTFLLHGFGHYYDSYELGSDGWAIRTTRITRLLLERT